MNIEIRIKCIYDPVEPDDGARVLVDRIWPRGITKEAAALTLWLKEVAPSTELRQWFGHRPERWEEFCRRYRGELDAQGPAIQRLREAAAHERLTLLFAARDRRHNNTVALAAYLGGREDKSEHGPVVVDEPSSPVCFATQADSEYSGYASRDELIAFLNELLEAERAGTKVAMQLFEEATDPALKALITTIYRDEARWCAMLVAALHGLSADPSPRTGAFYEKVMAIGDLPGRLVLLNRGQGWVARKLREMLPKIRDDGVRTELAEMLAAHERNIDLVEEHGSAQRSSAEKR
jgi:uncharacterized protein YeaO (DUF488 family)